MSASTLPAARSPGALASRDLDVVRELASVGCGQALTALGKLLRRRVEMEPPEVWDGARAGKLAAFPGAAAGDLVSVRVELEGSLAGYLVLALPARDAGRLAAALGHPAGPRGLGPVGESALLETGNIVGSAFLSAVARMLGARLLLRPPVLARGGDQRVLGPLVLEPEAVALATRFRVDGPDGLEGLVLVVPKPRSLATLLAALQR